jgi:mannose-1-phosphate guanylyltransferase
VKAIILASGKGTRLWPLSREKYSKQLKLAVIKSHNGIQIFLFNSYNLLDRNLDLHKT